MMGIFRVIIAGGGDFADYKKLRMSMDNILHNIVNREIVILCGKAKGADTLGERYAKEKGFAVEYYPADWNQYGKSAGYLRNKQMAENADALVAFWDGKSRGTKLMIRLARENNLQVRVISY